MIYKTVPLRVHHYIVSFYDKGGILHVVFMTHNGRKHDVTCHLNTKTQTYNCVFRGKTYMAIEVNRLGNQCA